MIIDIDQALGKRTDIRRRRLAVFRLMVRGYTGSEIFEELSSRPWWSGWSYQVVLNDMKVLRSFIRDYGGRIPEINEAISSALAYYESAIAEYDRLAREMEDLEKYELAARYRSMRDSVASRGFSALGVSTATLNLNHSTTPAVGEAIKEFFGIEISSETEVSNKTRSRNSKEKANLKNQSGRKNGKATKRSKA